MTPKDHGCTLVQIGRYTDPIMNRFLPLVLFAASGCTPREAPPARSAEPIATAPSEIAGIIKRKAFESRLSVDGLAFSDTALLVGTNVGVMEIRSARVVALYEWPGVESVVSGPWADPQHARVWVEREGDNVFLTFGKAGWKEVQLPPPPHGDYTRGDSLEGFQVLVDSATVRLLGGGAVWQWSGDTAWVAEPLPALGDTEAVAGFAALNGRAFYAVTDGGCGYLHCHNQGYWLEKGRWSKPLPLHIKGGVGQVLSASGAVFVRGDSGEVLQIERDSAAFEMAPGFCDALARRSDGKLIASFRTAGIYAFDGRWHKLFDDPSRAQGNRLAYLAEQGGVYALGTSTVPYIKPGTSDTWLESGEVGVWVSVGTQLVSVPIAHPGSGAEGKAQ